MSETQQPTGETPLTKSRRSPLRRIGCGILVTLWFALLMTPCALFYLAANREIRFPHADIPQPHEHPRLLISLISEERNRGLRIESATQLDSPDDLSTCVETDVRFILWESEGGDQDVTFCDCYRRSNVEAPWTLESTRGSVCDESG